MCGPEDKKKLYQVVSSACIKQQEENAQKSSQSLLGEKIKASICTRVSNKINSTPYIIICILQINTKTTVRKVEQVLSSGAAIQNMIVAAESMGYSCFWRTGDWAYNSYLYQSLGLGDNTQITGFLGIGKVDDEFAAMPVCRPKLEEHFSVLENSNLKLNLPNLF